jgi:hypothetical protein
MCEALGSIPNTAKEPKIKIKPIQTEKNLKISEVWTIVRKINFYGRELTLEEILAHRAESSQCMCQTL